jgi:hypothetical protein
MPLRRLCISMTALACLGSSLAAADAGQPTPEFLAEKAQLEEMVSSRQLDLFELQFIPGTLSRVVVHDRRGQDHVFNYLTCTIRNQATVDPAQLATRTKGYNEVLQAIAQQYETAKVETEGGIKLKIDGVTGQDGIVLERTESKLRTRTVALTAQASDENGTRIRLLDELPGSGPQEQFAFPDLGEPTSALVLRRIHEAVEEQEGRKLLSSEALRSFPLPPFDGVTRIEAKDITDPAHDTHGWLVGEAHVVLLFPRLSDYGDRFTIQINGLCNKMRFRHPAIEAGKPENYFQTRVLRRTLVLTYERPGDEFSRDLDHFKLSRNGYQWVESFQRTDVRRTGAYARFFLANISDEKGALNAAVKEQFWPYYEEQRAANAKLPDLKAGLTPQ